MSLRWRDERTDVRNRLITQQRWMMGRWGVDYDLVKVRDAHATAETQVGEDAASQLANKLAYCIEELGFADR